MVAGFFLKNYQCYSSFTALNGIEARQSLDRERLECSFFDWPMNGYFVMNGYFLTEVELVSVRQAQRCRWRRR
jgi:hypothetical protein